MPQRFQRRQIIWIPLKYVTKYLPRFFIVPKPAIRFCATPGSLNGIRIEDQRGVKRVISDRKIGMGECGASASDSNAGSDGTIIQRTEKMIGAVGVIHV